MRYRVRGNVTNLIHGRTGQTGCQLIGRLSGWKPGRDSQQGNVWRRIPDWGGSGCRGALRPTQPCLPPGQAGGQVGALSRVRCSGPQRIGHGADASRPSS
jgi:hypothetical protein